jgi:glycosyltransferase involved in cell wall biosynthesis
LTDAPIVVVSDASTDDTPGVARVSGAQVIELGQQIGAWGATQAGFRYALRRGYRQVASLDADGQHLPACLPELIAAQRETGADVVIGTFPERLSAPKRLAWAWFRALTGLKVEDLTSGLRIYGPRALRLLASPEATLLDYQDVGVLLLLRKYGLSVHEVPVTMVPRRNGHSRVFTSWFTVARYMAQTTILCLARFGRLGPPHLSRSDGLAAG